MTSGHDRTIRLWNPHRDGPAEQDSGLCVKVYKGSHAHEINGLCISHDNNRFASCGADKLVFLWDVATGQVNTPELSAHAAPARRTHLTPSTAPTPPAARPPARAPAPARPTRAACRSSGSTTATSSA
jgi:WD40 repeat protein